MNSPEVVAELEISVKTCKRTAIYYILLLYNHSSYIQKTESNSVYDIRISILFTYACLPLVSELGGTGEGHHGKGTQSTGSVALVQ